MTTLAPSSSQSHPLQQRYVIQVSVSYTHDDIYLGTSQENSVLYSLWKKKHQVISCKEDFSE